MRSLGSATTRFHNLPQAPFSSTPAVTSSSKSALVPEEEYVADDWLEDDMEEIQPKKKRRFSVEEIGTRRDDAACARGLSRLLNAGTTSRGEYFLFVSLQVFFTFILLIFFSSLSSSFVVQQGPLSEKERLPEASAGQNDSDAGDGQAGPAGGQQATESDGDGR